MKENPARPPQNMPSPLLIGIDIDTARIRAGLVNEIGRIVADRTIPMPTRTTRAAIGAIVGVILELASCGERDGRPIERVGVGVAGLVDPPTGRVSLHGLRGWTRVPVLQSIEEALDEAGHDIRLASGERRGRAVAAASGHPGMVIFTRNTAIAAAEAWTGAARGKQNVVYLSINEKIEAGILADGRALLGAAGFAAAAGWLAAREEFRNEYETAGCLTTEAAIQALPRHAIELWEGTVDSMLAGLIKTDPTAVDAAMILRSAAAGDELALRAVDATCRWLGRGIANFISILNPDAVLLGGEFGLLLRPHLDLIRDEARRWALPYAARSCKILSAALGEKAAVIGAAKLAGK
ncbi:MAG: ROK family protein [Blastocatellia bacterium]|nr:ROK family protein [Blastocatellia bacterium]